MKDKENRIVALDFAGYNFLPPSFFAFALNRGDYSGFTHRIAHRVVYPRSTELEAMMHASFALVPFSSNNIGEQIPMPPFRLPPPHKNSVFNVFHRSFEEAQVQASVNTEHKTSPVQQNCEQTLAACVFASFSCT